MNKYKLEIIVFISGALVMILELIGSRILAPYLGTSIFIWTSLIGIILGSLSLGYYFGGKLADKSPKFETFSHILLIAAFSVLFTVLIKDYVFSLVQTLRNDLRVESVIASIILFVPASICFGMVSPYAAKLKLHNVEKTGQTVGNLYALSTIGSITGTFLAGFFLISYIGNTKILVLISLTLILLSLLANPKKNLFSLVKILIFIALFFYLFSLKSSEEIYKKTGVLNIDTEYSNVVIYDDIYEDDQPIRRMILNNNNSSAMYLDSDDLVFEYTRFYRLAEHFFPNFKTSLMIGGGAYSFPKYFLKNYPEATMDVVEIDPDLTELSKKYFGLKDDARMRIYHEDGRTFLNNTEEKYDVIYTDAFLSFYYNPHQLATKEAVEKLYNSLNENGIVLANIITSVDGDLSHFLKAEYKTFQQYFPQIYLFPTRYTNDDSELQNVILVALKSNKIPTFTNEDPVLNKHLGNLKNLKNWDTSNFPVLTDEFAPVEKYIKEFFEVIK